MKKVAVLASTRGTTFQGLLGRKIPGVEFVCLLSNKKKNLALEKARNADIPAYGGLTEEEMIELLVDHNAEYILLIGFMRILSPDFVKAFEGKIFNVHPSLLPKYAGGMNNSVHESVLENGDSESGCTVHLVTAEVDEGPILVQKSCPVEEGETVDSLKAKVQALEVDAFTELLSS